MRLFRDRTKYIRILTAAFGAVIIFLALSGLESYNSSSAIFLNEVCTSNLSCLYDDDGRTPDWVELKNISDRDVDITGFYISRGSYEKEYCLPSLTVPAGGFLTITLPLNFSAGDTIVLSDRSGSILDSVNLPSLDYDTSFSRGEGKEWDRTLPTPDKENSKEALDFPELNEPLFSEESGFFDEPFYLSLSCGNGERIYYTLDGSEPDEGSFLYTGPLLIGDSSTGDNKYSAIKDISVAYTAPLRYVLPDYKVDKATVIRARVFDDKGRYSRSADRSFFVGFQNRPEYNDTPIASLIFDPADLFSDDKGIYVLGDRYRAYIDNNEEESYDKAGIWWWTPGNYSLRGREWERRAHLSFFDEDRDLLFDSDAGARIKGGGSRGFAQKSLKLTARTSYGRDNFGSIVPGNVRKQKKLALSSGGDDINTKLKDSLIAILAADTNIATLASRPCFVFLNGEYFGLYQLSEEFGRDYIAKHYGVNEENIVMIKNDLVKVGSPEDKELYDKLNSFITNTDFSKDREFETLCEMVDMDSLIDYFAVNIYIEHTNDWPGSNFALWRTKEKEGGAYGDCRWRWMLFDVNSVSMEKDKYDADTLSEVLNKNYIMKSLIKSPLFRDRFAKRMEELRTTIFDPARTDEEIDRLVSAMSPGMEGFYRRYYGDRMDLDHFLSEAEGLKEFYRRRGDYVQEHVKRICGE